MNHRLILTLLFISSFFVHSNVQAQWSTLSYVKKDHRLWIADVTKTDNSKVYGYLRDFSDSSIFLTNQFVTGTLGTSEEIDASNIKSITYHRNGSFIDGFLNAFIPPTSLMAVAVIPELDYWGGLIFAASMFYITPLSAVVGALDHTRERRKEYVIDGSHDIFRNQINENIGKACLNCGNIRLTTRGKIWYREISGNSIYYPITYRPVFHLYLAGGSTNSYNLQRSNGFIGRFEEVSPSMKKVLTSNFGVGFSVGKRYEVGAYFNSGTYIYDSWSYFEDPYQYTYYHDYDLFYSNFYLLYHLIPFEPMKQSFQLSAGGGITYYDGYIYQTLEARLDNIVVGRDSNESFRGGSNSFGWNVLLRGELFFSERYSIVSQIDYNYPFNESSSDLRLRAPLNTSPVESTINISSLTFGTGIRLHY